MSKTDVTRKQGQKRVTSCLFKQSPSVILEQSKDIDRNWTGAEKSNISFYVLFYCYYLSFVY